MNAFLLPSTFFHFYSQQASEPAPFLPLDQGLHPIHVPGQRGLDGVRTGRLCGVLLPGQALSPSVHRPVNYFGRDVMTSYLFAELLKNNRIEQEVPAIRQEVGKAMALLFSAITVVTGVGAPPGLISPD